MAKKNGTTYVLDKDGNPVAHLTETTLNISQEVIDASTKDSEGWVERLHGQRDSSIDLNLAYDKDSSENTYEFVKAITDREKPTIKFYTTDPSGALTYSNSMLVEGDVSLEAPLEDLVESGLTLVGDGKPTINKISS